MSKAKLSLQQAVDFCLESDEDSSTGGLSTDEEEELDNALVGSDNDQTYL